MTARMYAYSKSMDPYQKTPYDLVYTTVKCWFAYQKIVCVNMVAKKFFVYRFIAMYSCQPFGTYFVSYDTKEIALHKDVSLYAYCICTKH